VIPPKQKGEFVASLEDILDVDQKPYDPDEPWVTIGAFLAAHPRVYGGQPEACRRCLNAVLGYCAAARRGACCLHNGVAGTACSSASRAGPSAGSGRPGISTWPMTLTGRTSSWTAPSCGRTPVRRANPKPPEGASPGALPRRLQHPDPGADRCPGPPAGLRAHRGAGGGHHAGRRAVA
jgi:hypothetical protein